MKFQVAVSLIETGLPDDHQCHAPFFKGWAFFLYQIHCQCQITGLLNHVSCFLLNSVSLTFTTLGSLLQILRLSYTAH